MSITVSTLGFPRIGPRRELKSALERFWAGKTNAQSLLADAAESAAQGPRRALITRPSVAVSPYFPLTGLLLGRLFHVFNGAALFLTDETHAARRLEEGLAGPVNLAGSEWGFAGETGKATRSSGFL
jgi:hypothetical protein